MNTCTVPQHNCYTDTDDVNGNCVNGSPVPCNVVQGPSFIATCYYPCSPSSGCTGTHNDHFWSTFCRNYTTPIVVDVRGDGLRLTDRRGGVWFDLNANGHREHTAWLAPDSDDAFLAADRNGNGLIDDGSELFGDRTPQPASFHRDGFRALRLYDRDGDGLITGDELSGLLLWVDTDHDGATDAGELRSVSSAGITALSTMAQSARRRDRYSNLLLLRAPVTGLRGQPFTFDVFLRRG